MMEPAGRMKIVNPDVMASRVNAPAGTLRDTRGHGSFHAVLICKMHRTMHDRRGGRFFDGSCHVAFPVQPYAHAITDLELLRLPESLIRRLISQRRDRRPVGHEISTFEPCTISAPGTISPSLRYVARMAFLSTSSMSLTRW